MGSCSSLNFSRLKDATVHECIIGIDLLSFLFYQSPVEDQNGANLNNRGHNQGIT